MKQTIPFHQKPFYNEAVASAFDKTVQHTKQLLGTVHTEVLRSFFERVGPGDVPESLVYEMINPLVYFRLTREENGCYAIRFGIEPTKGDAELNAITVSCLRALFHNTKVGTTDMNIEDCILADWFINCCTEMYDYVETNNKYHTLVQLPYGGTEQTKLKRKKRSTPLPAL